VQLLARPHHATRLGGHPEVMQMLEVDAHDAFFSKYKCLKFEFTRNMRNPKVLPLLVQP
jgi:hypothetical protein